jgi:hypothetical protein
MSSLLNFLFSGRIKVNQQKEAQARSAGPDLYNVRQNPAPGRKIQKPRRSRLI